MISFEFQKSGSVGIIFFSVAKFGYGRSLPEMMKQLVLFDQVNVFERAASILDGNTVMLHQPF